jgi:hypothetical protein
MLNVPNEKSSKKLELRRKYLYYTPLPWWERARVRGAIPYAPPP